MPEARDSSANVGFSASLTLGAPKAHEPSFRRGFGGIFSNVMQPGLETGGTGWSLVVEQLRHLAERRDRLALHFADWHPLEPRSHLVAGRLPTPRRSRSR
jgi:hypothetical protein